YFHFFFFQAEDGIRDLIVTGVQTCALPIFGWCITTVVAWFLILFTGEYPAGLYEFGLGSFRWLIRLEAYLLLLVDEYPPFSLERSEERRVGKECCSWEVSAD